MPTTSNFGWTTPADTDLVKDGALAIRTLGNGIDTSMAQLKGGTTGQVLSKTSNTDMAFTWVTQDDANAIQNAIVDAKGDLIAASANDTPARLAVGNNGETLVADSSASTGLRWQTGNGLTQGIINGGFDIWQRGTSFNTVNYGADRWFNAGGNTTYSRESTAANLPTGFQYGIKMTMTGTDTPYSMQAVETANAIFYAGKRVVLSYYVSSTSSTNAIVRLDASTGTDTGVQGSFTQITPVSGYSASAATTTSMTRVYSVYDVPSDCRTLRIIIGAVSNITSGNSMTITGVQLEVGQVPTAFRRAGGTLAGERSACERYYWKDSSCLYEMFINNTNDNLRRVTISNPVTMRGNGSYTITLDSGSATVDNITPRSARVYISKGNTTSTAYITAIEVSAEL